MKIDRLTACTYVIFLCLGAWIGTPVTASIKYLVHIIVPSGSEIPTRSASGELLVFIF